MLVTRGFESSWRDSGRQPRMKTLQQKGIRSLVLPSVATKPVSYFVSQLLLVHAPRQGSAQLKPVLGDGGSLVSPVPHLLGSNSFSVGTSFPLLVRDGEGTVRGTMEWLRWISLTR